jgi:hypothetical protein
MRKLISPRLTSLRQILAVSLLLATAAFGLSVPAYAQVSVNDSVCEGLSAAGANCDSADPSGEEIKPAVQKIIDILSIVVGAETDVTGHLGMMERNRQMDADDASAARAERVKAGGRWIDIHDDDRDEGRQTKSDNNPSVMAAEREVTGPFGAEERQRIANDFDAGATEIEDRIGAPIEDGEIVVRRRQPLLAEPDTDPEVTDQREQTAERLRRSGSSWRRRLAIAGMAALMLFAKDRGPANPVADPGVAPVNTAPFVPYIHQKRVFKIHSG